MSELIDFRALCARVLKAEELILPGGGDFWKGYEEEAQALSRLMSDIRAALSAPQQGAPSDEELDALERQCWMATGVSDDSCCEYVFNHRAFARALLARFGSPAPVPVAERLPGAGDCALWPGEAVGEPWCWFGRLTDDDSGAYFEWIQCWPKYGLGNGYTHWHPWWVLPLPESS
ncbi:MAG: hypothetical protein VKI63_00175 [Cyanobium sp.]|nr:hypothetical protein [Cyanobium sp.]